MYPKILIIILCLFSLALLPSLASAENSTYGSGLYGSGPYGSSQGPNITLSIGTPSISYSGTSPITCNASDSIGINYLVMKVNGRKEAELTSSVFTTISYSILFSPKDIGLLEVTCEARSLLNYSETATGFINVYDLGSKSGNREKYTYTSITLVPDTVYRLTILDPEVGISEIDIRVLKYINDADFIAKPVSVLSEYGPPGKVYKFIQINSSALDESSLKSATIRFSVPSDWLAKNNISSSDIVLQRFHGGKWQTLDTKVLSKSRFVTEFESETPGFSVFAIATANPLNYYPSFSGEQVPSGLPSIHEGNFSGDVSQEILDLENPTDQIPDLYSPPDYMPPAFPPPIENMQENAGDFAWIFAVIIVIIILGYLHYHRYPSAKAKRVEAPRKKGKNNKRRH